MNNSQPNNQKPNSSASKSENNSKWYKAPWIKTMIKGLVISLPVVILIFLISLALQLVLNIVSPIANMLTAGEREPGIVVEITSIVILLGIFYLIGESIKHRSIRHYFLHIEKKYLSKVPLYSSIRSLVHQFTGLKEMPFSAVVLVDAFNTGVYMTGFVTERVTSDICTVFVPTAPNPTNGNIYHVPNTRIKWVQATPEDAMKTIVGMGVGSKCLFTEEQIKEIEEKRLNKKE